MPVLSRAKGAAASPALRIAYPPNFDPKKK